MSAVQGMHAQDQQRAVPGTPTRNSAEKNQRKCKKCRCVLRYVVVRRSKTSSGLPAHPKYPGSAREP